MSYTERDTYGIYNGQDHQKATPALMGASTLIGDKVHNKQDEHLGDIKEIMLDMRSGKIAYAVLSYGGVFTLGEKLFAVPWSVLTLDTTNKRFVIDVSQERFKDAPGFDSNSWPNMGDSRWEDNVHKYYAGANRIM